MLVGDASIDGNAKTITKIVLKQKIYQTIHTG